MSATAKVGSTLSGGQVEIDPKLPLMGPFYSLLLLPSSKVKRCEELERALTLFIEVLNKYEINADLRNSMVANAKMSVNAFHDYLRLAQRSFPSLRGTVTAAKRTFSRGADLPSENVASFHKDYQEVVRVYGVGHHYDFLYHLSHGLTLGLGKYHLTI